MIAAENQVIRKAVVQPVASAHPAPRIGLEQYYSEAGPDYAAWSREFNMHFGYYRAGSNPLHREAMLEQMNAEVLARLQLGASEEPRLLDLGCGLGATLRSIARRLPRALLLGLTRVPWQVERARALNETAGCSERVRVMEGDYEDTTLQSASYDGVYALESSCTRTAQTKALCWRRRIACCDPEDDSSLPTAFLRAGGSPTRCSSAFTASCASAGSSKSWRSFIHSWYGWDSLVSPTSPLRICKCVWRLQWRISHGSP
jgi:SAM-dependent methyltransferase